MAVLDTTRFDTPAAGIGARLWQAAVHFAHTLAAPTGNDKALDALSDAQLDDLGLCRADIIDMKHARRF